MHQFPTGSLGERVLGPRLDCESYGSSMPLSFQYARYEVEENGKMVAIMVEGGW